MKNHPFIRNFAAFTIATVMMPTLLYTAYSIIWPYSYSHLVSSFMPLSIASFLFYIMANLLSYCDLKNGIFKCYSYTFNFLAIWFPATSFAMHSNLQTLSDSKAWFECKMAIGNMLIALLAAEFCRYYLMKKEKESQTFVIEEDE